MYFVISLSRSDSTEPHSPSDLLPMSPSVYAVLRENLSPTTIETAVCSLSFLLLVKGTPNEANVVPINQSGWRSAWEVRKRFCWTKSLSITLGVSVCSCESLIRALKTDTFIHLGGFKFFPSKTIKEFLFLTHVHFVPTSTVGRTTPHHSPMLIDNTR